MTDSANLFGLPHPHSTSFLHPLPPYPLPRSLETEAILLCDDDIEVTENGLRIGFERWQEDKYRLVGYFPRAHYREVNGPRAGHMTYVLTPRQVRCGGSCMQSWGCALHTVQCTFCGVYECGPHTVGKAACLGVTVVWWWIGVVQCGLRTTER